MGAFRNNKVCSRHVLYHFSLHQNKAFNVQNKSSAGLNNREVFFIKKCFSSHDWCWIYLHAFKKNQHNIYFSAFTCLLCNFNVIKTVRLNVLLTQTKSSMYFYIEYLNSWPLNRKYFICHLLFIRKNFYFRRSL